jgi:hypothetical protein
MIRLATALPLLVALAAPAAGGEYSYAHRPQVVFPGGTVHVSPFPMGKRAAAVWASDACWRDCASAAAWRFQTCFGIKEREACRVIMDADDRACLRHCRIRGGPYVNITD